MPASFTDGLNRTWPLRRITVGDLDDLAALGLDVEAVSADIDLIVPLVSKPRTFAAALWWFVGAAVEKAGLTAGEFHKALDGDALARAVVALSSAIVDFFPLPPAEKAKALAQLTAALDGSADESSSSPPSPA